MPQDHQDTFECGCKINMQRFMDMNLSIRPHAIAWMDKDNSHIYQLLRVVPSLLEQVGSKKICTSWLNIVYDSNQG